ncbi:hypothetical protein [Agrobacterium leguminum]
MKKAVSSSKDGMMYFPYPVWFAVDIKRPKKSYSVSGFIGSGVLENNCNMPRFQVFATPLFRHSGLEPESSRRASARREKFFQPKDLGWLASGSRPE